MVTRKVTVTDSELTAHFAAVLHGEQNLNEDFSGSEKEQIRGVIRDFLKTTRSDAFDSQVKTMVRDYVKNDKDLEKHFVEICKNVLVQLYKTLWTKRSFWTSDLKNSTN